MRTLVLFACLLALAGVLAVAPATATRTATPTPTNGTLSVVHGKGFVMLEMRGSILGRLGYGTVTVTDQTPRDPYTATVAGKKLKELRVGPRTVRYKGQALRFRMVGGSWRVVVRGSGIALSAVGRGAVTLQAERLNPLDDAGVYSLDGVDCSADATSCTPLPDDLERLPLGVTQ
jgi:hypothetical protein